MIGDLANYSRTAVSRHEGSFALPKVERKTGIGDRSQSPNSGHMVYTKLDGSITPEAVLHGLLCSEADIGL